MEISGEAEQAVTSFSTFLVLAFHAGCFPFQFDFFA